MPKVMFLLSNPDDTVKLRMDREVKEIKRVISPVASHDFDHILIPAINVEELPGVIIKEKPNILHFSGHGNSNVLCFEDKEGKSKNIKVSALVNIFRETGKDINCLIINACKSFDIAKEIKDFIPNIISFPDKIEDELIEPFSRTFYETLTLGKSIESSFNLAKAVIESDIDDPNRLPILITNESLPNYRDIIFYHPFISASFNLKNEKPIVKDYHYSLKFEVKNLPLNSSYIIYEFIDSTISLNYRFKVVGDLNAGKSIDFRLYGNIIVRAWIWFGEKKYGIGIETTVKEGLENNYHGDIPAKCLKAYNDLINN